MVERPSGRSERIFDQSAANGRKEPNLTDAAACVNVSCQHVMAKHAPVHLSTSFDLKT